MAAVVTRDAAASALRLFFPNPHPSPNQEHHEHETSSSSSSSSSHDTAAAAMMVSCGQSRAQTLVQAASLLLLHQPAASALSPSTPSSSTSLQQQREDVAEEVAGALYALLAALKVNAITTINNDDGKAAPLGPGRCGHLLSLSLLVKNGVVEALAKLLQQAMHQPLPAPPPVMSIQSPAITVRDRDRDREEAPLVVARCVRALAILTQQTPEGDGRDDDPPVMGARDWLRAVSEESVVRTTTTTAAASKQKAGGLLKVLCAVVLRYSHCQQHHAPPPTRRSHTTTATADNDEVEDVLPSLLGGLGLGLEAGLGLGLLGDEGSDEGSDEGQRSVAVWGVAVLLDILVCTRRDLALALQPLSSSAACSRRKNTLAHYIQLAANAAATDATDANAASKAAVTVTLLTTTSSPSSSSLPGGGDARARAQTASSVRGKLLKGGVAASLSAVLQAHIDAVVRCEQAYTATTSATAVAGSSSKSGLHHHQRQQLLWPSTAAAAMAAKAMQLLLTLTLHTSSTSSVGATKIGCSSLACHLGRGTRVVDLDIGSGGGTHAAHASLRKVRDSRARTNDRLY